MRAKLELPTNVPVTVKLKYLPDGSRDYGYGPTWKYVVEHNGEEKTFFANERQYEMLKDYKSGDTILLIMKEEKNEQTGKHYKALVVRPALFDERGELVEPARDVVNDPEARKAFREQRVKMLAEAIEDVFRARELLSDAYGKYPEFVSEVRSVFVPDVVQKLATTLMIEEQRRT